MKIEVLENNIRLDNYLIDKLDSSRNKIQKLIKNNSILVNDKNTKSSYLVKTGDIITITDVKEEGTMNDKYLKTITLKDVLLYNDISNIVNPKNSMGCNIETLIDIYKDKNNNYCFKIESLECLAQDKSINTCK